MCKHVKQSMLDAGILLKSALKKLWKDGNSMHNSGWGNSW